MLEVVLYILSILGIIILVVLGLVTVLLLTVLFFPVSYRIHGEKAAQGFSLTVKVWWLFGLLRAAYSYPEPGYTVVKALFFKLFDTAPSEEQSDKDKESTKNRKSAKNKKNTKNSSSSGNSHNAQASKSTDKTAGTEETKEDTCPEEKADKLTDEVEGTKMGFFQKIQKLKCTIRELCDKISEIWENISYYLELIQEENTKQLFSHALLRSGKILKNIRPRSITAQIIFGLDSPDTTGYIYGLYCMFSSAFGPGVQIVPDFENSIFQGEFEVRGHITVWVALVNGLRLLLDKKLKIFRDKLKKGKRETDSQNGGKNGR